ncbi:MAG: hypothetical protein WC797_02415 [Candidatus Paceibacterota bacterium]|jgi:hypothetical protein
MFKERLLALSFIVAAVALAAWTSADTWRPLSGFAWSGNIGWISFSYKNCDKNGDNVLDRLSLSCREGRINSDDYGVKSNYSVKINIGNGNLAGYAWSSNIGWIYFGPQQDGNNLREAAPAVPSVSPTKYWAKVDFSDSSTDGYRLTGWARACSVYANGCSGELKDDLSLGGWDGWISMSAASTEPAERQYAVKLKDFQTSTSPKFLGYAWGGGVTNVTRYGTNYNKSPQFPGWISFSGTGYAVVIGDPDPGSLVVMGCDVTPAGTLAYAGQPVQIKADVEGGTSSGNYTFAWAATSPDLIVSGGDSGTATVKFANQGQGRVAVDIRAGTNRVTRECLVGVHGTDPDFFLDTSESVVQAAFLAGNNTDVTPTINISVSQGNSANTFTNPISLSARVTDLDGNSVSGLSASVFTFSDHTLTYTGGNYNTATLNVNLVRDPSADIVSGVYMIEIIGTSTDDTGASLVRRLQIRLNLDAPDTGYIET